MEETNAREPPSWMSSVGCTVQPTCQYERRTRKSIMRLTDVLLTKVSSATLVNWCISVANEPVSDVSERGNRYKSTKVRTNRHSPFRECILNRCPESARGRQCSKKLSICGPLVNNSSSRNGKEITDVESRTDCNCNMNWVKSTESRLSFSPHQFLAI
jgi:hypothetical protein